MAIWSWDTDSFNENGKLILLYRHQRFIDEGFIGNRVLDVGGWGKLAFRLKQEGKNVVLIDIDKLLLKAIKERFKGVEVVLSKAEELPFVNGSFDTVHCSETLEHVKSAEEVCDEVYRVLSMEGIFCGTVPIPDVVHKRSEAGIRFFSEDELKNLLSKFQIIKIENTSSVKPKDKACSIMFVCRRK